MNHILLVTLSSRGQAMASLPGDAAAADLAMTPSLIVPQCRGDDGESLRERPLVGEGRECLI